MRGTVNPDAFEMQEWLTPKEIDDYRIGFLHQRTHFLKLMRGDKPNTRNMDRVRWDCSLIYQITLNKLTNSDSDDYLDEFNELKENIVVPNKPYLNK